MSALEQVRSSLSRGGPLLGIITYWTLSDARIDRATLESIWSSSQLEPSHLAEAPTAEKVLKLAAREAALGQRDRLIRIAKDDESELVFGIIREMRHADGTLSYTQEARVSLTRSTESVGTDAPAHDLTDQILTRFRVLRSTHPPDDIRRSMMKTLDACAAVTLRDHGGVYWIPAPYADTVRRLQQAIEQIGSSRVYLLPVHDSVDASKTLGEAAKLSVEEELAAMKLEIDAFVAEPPERASTLVRRLDAFAALKSRAELYRSVLNVHVQDLDATLQHLSATVEKLLDQKAAA